MDFVNNDTRQIAKNLLGVKVIYQEMKSNLAHPLNKGNIRTGETTPYSNIALESNVTF